MSHEGSTVGCNILIIGENEQSQAMQKVISSAGLECDVDIASHAIKHTQLFNQHDLVIVMHQPDRFDSIDLVPRIRKVSLVPIIVIGDQSEVDAVITLELGADDYMAMFVPLKVLVARIRAIIRRYDWQRGKGKGVIPPIEYIFEDLIINKVAREITAYGERVHLTRKEYDLLIYLADANRRIVSRNELLSSVWGYRQVKDNTIDSRTVDVHIGRLRMKIEADPKNPRFIITAQGAGYRFAGQEIDDEIAA